MPADYTIPQLRWPMVIDSSNDTFDFNEGVGGLVCDIPDGTYFWRGDRSATDMALVLETALETAGLHSYTVTLSGAGLVTITDNTGTVNLDWTSGDVDREWFGFNWALTGFAASHTSDFQVGRSWYPEQVFVADSRQRPVYGGSQQRMADGSIDTQRWSEHWLQDILIDMLPARKVWQAEEVREQEAWNAGTGSEPRPSEFVADGERFEFCPDFSAVAAGGGGGALTNPGDATEAIMVGAVNKRAVISETPNTIQRWDLTLHLQHFVS